DDSTVSIILGCPWLQKHRPELSWGPCNIIHWSEHCQTNCLVNLPHSPSVPVLLPEPSFTPEIPAEYMAFQDVFSKQRATHLPPHRPWDCANELLPGAQLPKARVYPLSIPERQAMEYIAEALSQGFIQPSTSPAASSCFFVGKKDGGLHPCINYRQLNSQIRQQPYPLPLVPAALEELCGAQIFTKLDLRSAYNLVRIRAGEEWKTAFVTPTGHYKYRVTLFGLSISPSVFQTFMNLAKHRQHVQQVLHKLRKHSLYLKIEKCDSWGTSMPRACRWIRGKSPPYRNGHNLSVKELQCFLGFSNFYRRFIQNYSSITAPLTSLLRGKPKTLIWNPTAREAFQWLKEIFSTAPLLHHPDPKLPFTVEVDASTTGVGAVLPQAVGEPPLLHPCAFYSRKLSPAEQNYDVGNRELLAIKLALEEWCHWLEGSTHPFTIITDHKNLQYLREARRLNPRQARWALFFTRFNFKITYRPGSKNISADALSQQFSSDHPAEPEPIIPSNLIISPILWDQDETIRQATLQEPAPPECPEGKIFVPRSQRLPLLGAAHQQPTDPLAPSNPLLVAQYVPAALSVLCLPLPVNFPQENWYHYPFHRGPLSHIGVDFVTDLPSSEGNTCILVMVDRFSQMCKFFPLKGLPTALETAEHLFQQVFHHFGLPEEIVLDWGPQFISHVWKPSFKLLGVSVDPSSGYHPQTNGQTERKIQELGRYLRAYCHEDQHSWSRFLPWAEYAHNSLHQDTTGLTPFQCVLGYQPPLFPWMEEPSHVPAVDHWLRESERVWDSAHHHLHDLRFTPRYIGPFKILRQINDVTLQLQLPPRYRIHTTFHVSLLKPFYFSATDHIGAEAEPPPPEVLDQPSIYTVHEILDSRCRGGHLEYLVDWEGYGPEERSWVPGDDILDPTLLLDFHRSHPDCPAPRGCGRREPPLEEGVVSGIHHIHLHLPHLR
ncbi:hypothetical protein M9458_039961, partial [Cirrhinus mrigala]